MIINGIQPDQSVSLSKEYTAKAFNELIGHKVVDISELKVNWFCKTDNGWKMKVSTSVTALYYAEVTYVYTAQSLCIDLHYSK